MKKKINYPFRIRETVFLQDDSVKNSIEEYMSFYFKILDTYLNYNGSKEEKYIATAEIYLPVFKRKHYFGPDNEKILWDLKRKIFGDESLSTDNWIDMGMANI